MHYSHGVTVDKWTTSILRFLHAYELDVSDYVFYLG